MQCSVIVKRDPIPGKGRTVMLIKNDVRDFDLLESLDL